jgi:hypothetical protein
MSGFLLQCIVGCIFYSVGLIIPRKSLCMLFRVEALFVLRPVVDPQLRFGVQSLGLA